MGLDQVNQKLAACGNFIVDWGGLMYCAFIMLSAYFVGLHFIVPASGLDYNFFWWIAHFLVLQALMHMYFFHRFSEFNNVHYWQREPVVADLCRQSTDINDYTGRSVALNMEVEGVEPEGTLKKKFCHACNRDAPLRSHHCPLCKICVIRKDHHCFITGKCVGLGNQRFFMTFLFWVIVGLSLVSYKILVFFMEGDPYFWPIGFLKIMGPVALARYALSYCSDVHAMLGGLLTVYLSSIMAATAFLCLQLYYTAYGYTMYEYHSAPMRQAFDGDGSNMGERFRLVFGRYWPVNFLFPLFWEKPILTPQIANNLFRVRSKLL